MIQCALSNNFCLLWIFTILANGVKDTLGVIYATRHLAFCCVESLVEGMNRTIAFFVSIYHQFCVSIEQYL
jgi:hypothetical protein